MVVSQIYLKNGGGVTYSLGTPGLEHYKRFKIHFLIKYDFSKRKYNTYIDRVFYEKINYSTSWNKISKITQASKQADICHSKIKSYRKNTICLWNLISW